MSDSDFSTIVVRKRDGHGASPGLTSSSGRVGLGSRVGGRKIESTTLGADEAKWKFRPGAEGRARLRNSRSLSGSNSCKENK